MSAPQQSALSSPAIVIDSNLAIWAVVPVLNETGIDVMTRFTSWIQAGVRFIAPSLWRAECTSTIRRGVHFRVLSAERARIALADVLTLQVEQYALTDGLCLAALDWARRLQQVRAYDAFYVALVDELDVDLWTADQRLANGARQAGTTRVHWIGES